MRKSFGDRVREERERLGWTRTDLSRESGVSRQVIIRVEEDPRAFMTVETARKIARALRVSIDHLAGTWEAELTAASA